MMRHVTVYGEPGIYAGWPANHGAWQWGDEFLVGFMRGTFKRHRMHNIVEPFQKVQARSRDGGETWKLEIPNVDFESTSHIPLKRRLPKNAILRFCGNYDHGGEYCHQQGGFYVSTDKGHEWVGPYAPRGVNPGPKLHNTSRTCVLGDLVFGSAAQREVWGTDMVYCTKRNGSGFQTVLDDDYRAVMPAAAKIGTRVVVVMRRRGARQYGGWIDAVYSDNGAETWTKPTHVADTGLHNGNPPALIEGGGVLYCAYGYRGDERVPAIWVCQSKNGIEWVKHRMLRFGTCSDIGYPRLFKRSDGKLVCVYYWSDEGEEQRIEATIFDGLD